LKFSAKKVVFSVLSGKKQISPVLFWAPLEKFWKNPLVPPLEEILPTPMAAGREVQVPWCGG